MGNKYRFDEIIEEHRKVYETIDKGMLDRFTSLISTHNRLFFIGVGREGLQTRAFAMRIMHMGKETHWIWDDTTPSIGEGDLLIATSGSGCIGHIDYVCRQAKEAGAKVAVITGSPSGQTAQNADFVLFIPASVYKGTDKVVPSVQPMGNLFEQCLLTVLDAVVMSMVEGSNCITFEKMSMRHRNVE